MVVVAVQVSVAGLYLPPEFSEHAYGRSSHELARYMLDRFPEFAAIERGFGFWNLLDAMHHLAGRVHRRQWTISTTRSIRRWWHGSTVSRA